MSGHRPANGGNRSTLRVGPKVSHRLRAAGINVSPAARKHGHEGVFVSARGLDISVLVDLVLPDKVRGVAEEVARVVTTWGLKPDIVEKIHDDGTLTAWVRFTYPDPHKTEESGQASARWEQVEPRRTYQATIGGKRWELGYRGRAAAPETGWYLVGGLDGKGNEFMAKRLQEAADAATRRITSHQPVTAPEPPQEAGQAPHASDSKGRRWEAGQRAVFRTRDGFLMTGEVTGFGEEDGQRTATVLVDTRQVAPAARAPKGITSRPGKPRPVEPPREWVQLLDELTPA